MALAPKYISYAIGSVFFAVAILAFWIRHNDIDRIERVINQKVAAVAEADEERIRDIVQQEVAALVSGHERIPPNMIQTVTVKCPECDVKRVSTSVDQRTLARVLEIKNRIAANRTSLTGATE